MANEVKGLKELAGKLSKLETKLAVKSLRGAIFKATTPVVRQMKSRVPIGTEAHRTYKRRLVSPSFSQRSIKRLTGKKYLSRGKLSIAIGVRAEAYYAIRFYDQGPYTITQRRQSTSRKARAHVGNQRRKISIQPYTLRKVPWFESTFRANESMMIKNMKDNLKDIIMKAVKRG